jgi:predicted RNA polymerase sigma factor
MVSLNRAIAAAVVQGPAAGLGLLEALDRDPRLAGHYRLDAVRGHLLQMAGDPALVDSHHRAAAERTRSIPERDYLIAKAARVLSEGRGTSAGARAGAPAQ